MSDGFPSVIRSHAKQLQRLEGAQADEFLRLLHETQQQLVGRFASMGGQSDPLDAFRIRAAIGEAEAAILALERKATGEYVKGSDDSVELAIEHIGEELNRLSHGFDLRPSRISLDAQKAFADPMQGLLANHFETSVKRYGLDALNQIRQRLFVGLRAGDSLTDISRDLQGRSGPFGTLGKSNADRLVRTEISTAYNVAHQNGYKQAREKLPDLHETWVHIGSYKCDACESLDGTERPKDGYWTVKLGKKIRKVAHPPLHPNCVCRLIATRPEWKSGLKKLGYLN